MEAMEVAFCRADRATSSAKSSAEVFNGNTEKTTHTIWLFHIAMENGPFIDDFPNRTTINSGFSKAILNSQMVQTKTHRLGNQN